MHELGMCESILDAVLRRADGRTVQRVRLRVGVLHRVEEPALDQSFALVAEGTPAQGATLDLVVVPVGVRCGACGWEGVSDDPLVVCPACTSTDVAIDGGDELVLESLELARE